MAKKEKDQLSKSKKYYVGPLSSGGTLASSFAINAVTCPPTEHVNARTAREINDSFRKLYKLPSLLKPVGNTSVNTAISSGVTTTAKAVRGAISAKLPPTFEEKGMSPVAANVATTGMITMLDVVRKGFNFMLQERSSGIPLPKNFFAVMKGIFSGSIFQVPTGAFSTLAFLQAYDKSTKWVAGKDSDHTQPMKPAEVIGTSIATGFSAATIQAPAFGATHLWRASERHAAQGSEPTWAIFCKALKDPQVRSSALLSGRSFVAFATSAGVQATGITLARRGIDFSDTVEPLFQEVEATPLRDRVIEQACPFTR